MTDFPTSIDTFANPSAGDTTAAVSHAAQHGNANDAIEAIETKLGTGASVPASNTLLRGTGAGTSEFSQLTSAQLAATLSDETGSGSAVFANTPTLVTPKADTINESTPANGVTVDGVLLKDGKMNGSYITDSSLASAQLGTGMVVQVSSVVYTNVATGTTLMPYDDTIPQNTEGDEYMSLAFTPKSATNILVIQVNAYVSHSAITNLSVVLFQDTTANGLATAGFVPSASTYWQNVPLTHRMVAGTTSSTTFKVRVGGSNAGTTTFNGTGGARRMGAISKSGIVITEYKA